MSEIIALSFSIEISQDYFLIELTSSYENKECNYVFITTLPERDTRRISYAFSNLVSLKYQFFH
jgi:hypothetical protein